MDSREKRGSSDPVPAGRTPALARSSSASGVPGAGSPRKMEVVVRVAVIRVCEVCRSGRV